MIEEKELSVVKAQASKALIAANEMEIKVVEDMTKATDILSRIKQVGKLIKERKEAITKPLMESLNSVRSLFKPIEQNHAEAESIIKSKMLSFQLKEEKKAEAQKAKIVEKVESGKIEMSKALEKIEAIPEATTNLKGKTGSIQTRTIKKVQITSLKDVEINTALLKTYINQGLIVWNEALVKEAVLKGMAVEGAIIVEEKIISAK